MTELKKLKRAVIKEELVALTGNFKKAIVLSQMIYWSERVKDADKFFQDEIKRSKGAMGREEREYAEKLEEVDLLSHGWIYKSAEDLSEETMMGVAKSTMGTYLTELVEKGWLNKRKNPKWKGDNTFQYRVDLLKIQQDLFELGYALEGYPLLVSAETELPSSEIEHHSSEIEQSVLESNNQFENRTTLPEITTEITSYTLEEEEEEEEVSHSKLISFLLTKDITLENAIKFETRLLKEGLTDYTNEDVIEALRRSFVDFKKGICESPYLWAVGKLKTILDTKNKVDEKETSKTKSKSSKKTIRTELLPDWFEENPSEQSPTPKQDGQAKDPKEHELKKLEIEEMLEKLRS